MQVKSIEDLNRLRTEERAKLHLDEKDGNNIRVLVGMATCGIAAGARPVYEKFVEEVSRRGLKNVTVTETGCVGVCQYEPVVEVYAPGQERVTYVKMTADKVLDVVTEHLVNGHPVKEYVIGAYQK